MANAIETFLAQARSASDEFKKLAACDTPSWGPLTSAAVTEGDFMHQLLKVDSAKILPVMRTEYIHFLHRLTTMGLLPTRKCGAFRKTSVHIEANPDLF